MLFRSPTDIQVMINNNEKGVKIAFGTDAGVQKHGTNWKEFVYMVQENVKDYLRDRWDKMFRQEDCKED